MAKMMLAVGLVVDYSYFAEIFTAFYSMDRYEVAMTLNRIGGAYAWVFWGTILCNVLQIQLLWFARMRRSHGALFLISVGVLIGMWLERFMLIVTSLYRDFMPSSWGMFYPTFWDIAFLAGSVGLFFVLYLLFVRWRRWSPCSSCAERCAAPAEARSVSRSLHERVLYGLLAEFASAEQLLAGCTADALRIAARMPRSRPILPFRSRASTRRSGRPAIPSRR